jgi:uncharacterized ferredoxin-like protein
MRCQVWSRSKLRRAGILLGLLGGLAQLAVAFMGDAIGGMSTVVVLLAVDAVAAVVGALLILRWTIPGVVVMAIAGVGAVVALFSTILFEIGVAALLFGAVAAALVGKLTHSATNT